MVGIGHFNETNVSMNQRHSIRKAAWTGILAKIAMVLPVLVIPKVLVPMLGAERFGIVLTILSLVTFLSVSDLGIGSNLITTLSSLVGQERYEEAARVQTNGFAIVGVIALILFLISLVLFKVNLSVQLFPETTYSLQIEASRAIAVMVMMFALTTPLTLVNKIQFAFNRGHVANLWQVGAALLNFSFACSAAWMGMGIVGVVIGLSFGNILCGSVNTIFHLCSKSSYQPRIELIDFKLWKVLIQGSSFYLVMQIIYLSSFGLDAVLVARGLGPSEAAKYALADRFFSIVAIATTIVTTPLWAIYGKANGTRQYDLSLRTLKKWTLRIIFAAFLITLCIAIFINPTIRFLSSDTIIVPFSLAIAMGAWRVIESLGASLSVYIYTIDKAKFIMITGMITAATSLFLKLLLLPNVGSVSLPLVTSFCCIVFSILPCLLIIRRHYSFYSISRAGQLAVQAQATSIE